MPTPPEPSPKDPNPAAGEDSDAPRHDTRDELRAVSAESKRQKARRPWVYALSGLLGVGGVSTGGISIARGESQETTNARMQERHGNTERRVDELKLQVDGGLKDTDKRLGKVERKVDSMRAEQRVYNQLILEKLGVPKSKQPPKPDDDE